MKPLNGSACISKCNEDKTKEKMKNKKQLLWLSRKTEECDENEDDEDVDEDDECGELAPTSGGESGGRNQRHPTASDFLAAAAGDASMADLVAATMAAAAAAVNNNNNNTSDSGNAGTTQQDSDAAGVTASSKSRSGRSDPHRCGGSSSGHRKSKGWDDDFVLKRQFSALIPAFDPRPGRINVNQTQDVSLQPPIIPGQQAENTNNGVVDNRANTEAANVNENDQFGRRGSDSRWCVNDSYGSRTGSAPASNVSMKLTFNSPSTNPEVSSALMEALELADDSMTIFAFIQSLVVNNTANINNSNRVMRQLAGFMGGRNDKSRRIWEYTYSLIYAQHQQQRDEKEQEAKSVKRSASNTLIPIELLATVANNDTCSSLANLDQDDLSRSDSGSSVASNIVSTASTLDIVQLLQVIRDLAGEQNKFDSGLSSGLKFNASSASLEKQQLQQQLVEGSVIESLDASQFGSPKITQKLIQQLQDPLVVASGALPGWCDYLIQRHPMLFDYETRVLYFRATAFGTSRAIVWLQSQRDGLLESQRNGAGGSGGPGGGSGGSGGTRRDHDYHHEYRVGRIKHERVKVPRARHALLPWAQQVMNFHAERKSILEIEFENEEGTGLGPTLEFYSLVAGELQRVSLGLWLHEPGHAIRKSNTSDSDSSQTDADTPTQEDHITKSFDDQKSTYTEHQDETDRAKGPKLPRIDFDISTRRPSENEHMYYVPPPVTATLRQDISPRPEDPEPDLLNTVDIFVRCHSGLFPAPRPQTNEACGPAVEERFEFIGVFLAKVLQDSRLVDIPLSSPFLKLFSIPPPIQVASTSTSPQGPTATDSSTEAEESWNVRDALDDITKSGAEDPVWYRGLFDEIDFEELYPIKSRFLRQLAALTSTPDKSPLIDFDGHECTLEDLGLTFQLNPSSQNYDYEHVDLIPDGGNVDVTLNNVEEYVKLCKEFYFYTGLCRQMTAFRRGFCRVFPIHKLTSFTPAEIRTLICGEQYPRWTQEEILQFTEPKLGYSKESKTFLDFVEIMVEMDGDERRRFLQFATGCSSLPPGGLANLHPRLTIVRKVDASDGSYPSVNTCVHYLKLPQYSSKTIMRQRIIDATNERGFHLN